MVGSIVISTISDKIGKRKPLIVMALMMLLPALILFVYAGNWFETSRSLLIALQISSFVIGFCIMGIGPVGFQYAAERCAPAPESASQGMLLWIGQIAGIAMVVIMSADNNHYLLTTLHTFCFMALAALLLSFLLTEKNTSTTTGY